MEKSNFKKLLATASAFAVITGAATGASAANLLYKSDNGGDSVIEVGAQITNATLADGSAVAANWDATDSFHLDGKAQDITLGANGNPGSFATIDLKGSDGRTITVVESSTGGSIINSTNDKTATLVINNGRTYTALPQAGKNAAGNAQPAGDYSGVSAITLGHGGNAVGSSFVVNNGITNITDATTANNIFSQTITTVQNGEGVLQVSAGSAAAFTGTVGANGTALKTITLNGEASFSEAVFATAITATEKVSFAKLVTGAATVTKEAAFTKGITGDLTSTANTADISVGTAADGATTDLTGTLDLTNGGKATVYGQVTGVATAKAGATINILKNDAATANAGNAHSVVAEAKSKVTVAGNVTTGGVTADGEGTTVFVTGDVTAGGVAATDKAVVEVTGNVVAGNTNAGANTTVKVGGNAQAVVAQAAGGSVIVGGNAVSVAMNNGSTVSVAGDITTTTTLTNAGDKLTLGKGTSTGAVTNAGQIYVTGDRVFADANGGANLGKVEVQDTAEKVTFGGASGLSGATLTTTGEAVHDIILTESQTLANGTVIGTEANQFRNIQIADGKTLTLANEKTYAAVTADVANKGTLIFNRVAGITTIRSIGTNAKPLALVTFTENATVLGDAYAEQMEIAAGKTATLGGVVETSHANGVRFTAGGTGTAVFKDGTTLNAVITTNAGNNGAVTFEGAATISNAIAATGAKIATVNFNGANKTVEVGGNIYANTGINIAANATAQLTKDITFESAKTALTDGIIDAQSYKLSHTGNVELNSDSNVVKATLTSNASTKDLEGGTIVITAGALTKVANGKLILNIDDTGVKRKQGGNRTFKVITSVNATNLTDADVTITGGNRKAASYTVKIVNPGAANSEVLITDVDLAGSYFGKKFGNTAMFNRLAALADGTDGAEFLGLLSDLDSTNSVKAQEAESRVRRGSVVSESLTTAMDGAALNVDARMGEVSAPSIQTASGATVTGVAAGDDAARFGAWASPFYGRVNQSARNGFSGYKNEAYGLTVGLDTKVNEDLVLGVSVSAAHSNIKHKDTKSGDRTKVDTLLFSLYHTQAISDNWFLSGNMTFATNDINNTAKRNIATGYETATAKYSVTSFDLKEMVGYNYAMGEATITPMIGAKYTRVNNASYKESGTTFQNLDIATKAFDKLEAIAGGKITGNAYDVSGISVTPEAHAFIQYDLLNRTQKQSVSLSGVDLDATTDKTARMKYNLGLGVSSKYGAMEYGAGYDLQLASKRVGHQGSLKVRVNF